jgi:hypothetical protein
MQVDTAQLPPQLDPAATIRTIGALNDRADALAVDGINVFFGTYSEFDLARDKSCPIPSEVTGGDPITPHYVAARQRYHVIFFNEEAQYITRTFWNWYAFECALQRAIQANLKLGVHPDWLMGSLLFLFDDMIDQYRQAYHAAHGKPLMLTSVGKGA